MTNERLSTERIFEAIRDMTPTGVHHRAARRSLIRTSNITLKKLLTIWASSPGILPSTDPNRRQKKTRPKVFVPGREPRTRVTWVLFMVVRYVVWVCWKVARMTLSGIMFLEEAKQVEILDYL